MAPLRDRLIEEILVPPLVGKRKKLNFDGSSIGTWVWKDMDALFRMSILEWCGVCVALWEFVTLQRLNAMLY